MTKTPTRVRILMTPSSGHDDDDRPQPFAGPATVLTGLRGQQGRAQDLARGL